MSEIGAGSSSSAAIAPETNESSDPVEPMAGAVTSPSEPIEVQGHVNPPPVALVPEMIDSPEPTIVEPMEVDTLSHLTTIPLSPGVMDALAVP